MASSQSSLNSSLKLSLHDHVANTNAGIQRLLSARSIPLWINPNNGNFYISNPYKAGDIVILLSDKNEVYYILRHYYENIALNIGVEASMFFEKNDPNLTDDVISVIVNGGYLLEDKYINPMTRLSTSEKGYDLFISLKNQNYDIPGASESWFNLDMSESLDSIQLQLSRIVSILTSNNCIDNTHDQCIDPNGTKYGDNSDKSTYLANRLDMHKTFYHFGDGAIYAKNESENALEALNTIQKEIDSHTNTASSVMKNPLYINGEVVGNTVAIKQTTGQMFFYCILDVSNIDRDKDIKIEFTPNLNTNVIVPLLLNTTSGLLEVDNLETDEHVLTKSYVPAWFVDSYANIVNDSSAPTNIIIKTTNGYETANFNNLFNGFADDSYIATYTPIGTAVRTPNAAIHGSPIKEIERTKKSLTIQLASDYVWEYSGLAISLSGKCEVN